MNSTRPCPHSPAIWEIVASHLPDIAKSIGVPLPNDYLTEQQCAAHNDGDFLRVHRDIRIGDDGHQHRIISMVWYFYNRPKRFSGGELRLHSLDRSKWLDIEPADNMAIFFPSYALHEVREVSVPSGDFSDGRFAFVGWIRHDRSPSAE